MRATATEDLQILSKNGDQDGGGSRCWPSVGSETCNFFKNVPSSFHTYCESESFLTTFCVIFIHHVQFLKRARLGRKYSKDMFSIKFRNKG